MRRFLKRMVFVVLVCSLFLGVLAVIDSGALQYLQSMQANGSQPMLKAGAAVVVNRDTGKIVYNKHENMPMHPASLTKLMTVLLAAEQADWSQPVTVGDEISFVGANASVADLCVGDSLTVEELVWAALLPSGNDAAYVLAAHVGRLVGGERLSTQAAVRCFVELMNTRAHELGARGTRFVNPDGFHHDYHVATAYDLSIIGLAAYEHPQLSPMFAETEHCAQVQRAGSIVDKTWHNTNLLLDESSPYYYQWADGLKTGTTPQAGYCLAVTASKGEQRLLAIILRSTAEGRYTDATAILDYVFSGGEKI